MIRKIIRSFMRSLAKFLNTITAGRLSPNTVTITGLLAHIPIALAIADERFILAAVLLFVFGLFDALDGELARLQKKASDAGMLLDASTDRMKEIILYIGISYYLIADDQQFAAVWAVAACGFSLLVSYVKAKGETAIAKSNLSTHEINYLFQDGLMNFEARMAVLIIGLLSGHVAAAVIVVAIGAFLNAIKRLANISKKIG